MMKGLRLMDIAVMSVLLLSLTAVAIAAYIYMGKEADYQASKKEYEDIESEYVTHEDSSFQEGDPGQTDHPSRDEDKADQEEEPLPIEIPLIDWEGLKELNADIIAWLEVPAVEIRYPVLQGSDNQEYLHRSASGEWHSAGSIFLDSENSSDFTDPNSIIYGHNMRNGSMFAVLKSFNSQDIYDNCPYFWVCTEKKNLLCEIVSVHLAVTADESFTLFPVSIRSGEIDKWVKNEIGKSQITCGIPERHIRRMVTLSTCTPSSDETRQLVQAVVIRELRPS